MLIIDSSRIGSELLASALKKDKLEVTHAGASADEALTVLSKVPVDVALISATIEGNSKKGFDITGQIRALNVGVQVVMLIENSNRDSVVEAFRAGARGVFGRDNSLEALSKCVIRVHHGQVWASSEELRHLLEALVGPPQLRLVNASGSELLAPREQEVVHWVAEGLTNREIANRLGLSENTVKNYMFRIFDKLGISKRVELVLYAASQYARAQSPSQDGHSVNRLQNDAEVLSWCRAAVESFTSIPLTLGQLTRDGRGTQADKEEALMWFTIAELVAAEMVEEAKASKTKLHKNLSHEQVQRATEKAKEWLNRREPEASERGRLERAV